jgi:signal peptidase I
MSKSKAGGAIAASERTSDSSTATKVGSGSGKQTPPGGTKKGPPSALVEWGKTIAFVVVFYFVFTALVAEAFFIPSGSMEPTLHEGNKLTADRILVAKGLVYKMLDIDRGDIVVFRAVDSKEEPFWRKLLIFRQDKPDMLVKRVVGLPGDHVSIEGRRLHINGKPVSDPEVFQRLEYTPYGLLAGSGVTLPEDRYLVLGDNTDNSRDGRMFGLLPAENIVGIALFRFWPPLRVGPIRYPTP